MTRGKFSFWLDFKKDDELLLADTIDELKQRRSFSAVIREGIQIVNELRQGRVDTLLARYPWIVDKVRELAPPPAPPTPQPFDMTELLRQFEAYMEQRGKGQVIPDTREGGFPLMQPGFKSSGKLGSISLAMPVIDDDDDDSGNTIVLTKSSGTTITDNFFASAAKCGF